MKNKKSNTISVLFMRGAGDDNISFNININILKVILIVFSLFIISLISFSIYYGKISQRIIFINNTIKENGDLKKYVGKIEIINSEILKIKAFEKKIKILTMNYSTEESYNFDLSDNLDIDKHKDFIDKGVDEFVQNIKLHRNLYLINIKDKLVKRKNLLRAIPNILPVDGWISRGFQEYSLNNRMSHKGIDIAAAYDSPIRAAGPGIVTFTGWKKDFGNIIEIDHGYGFLSRYGHCSRFFIKKGDIVERSATIAFVGSSGRSSAPHLHFEIIKDGKKIDPMIFILK